MIFMVNTLGQINKLFLIFKRGIDKKERNKIEEGLN